MGLVPQLRILASQSTRKQQQCAPDGHGNTGLRPEARVCRLGRPAIHEITALSVTEPSSSLCELKFSEDQRRVAEPIVAEILAASRF